MLQPVETDINILKFHSVFFLNLLNSMASFFYEVVPGATCLRWLS